MRNLSASEVSAVTGAGVIPAIAVLGFVYYERENIRDFVEGFFEGYEREMQS